MLWKQCGCSWKLISRRSETTQKLNRQFFRTYLLNAYALTMICKTYGGLLQFISKQGFIENVNK